MYKNAHRQAIAITINNTIYAIFFLLLNNFSNTITFNYHIIKNKMQLFLFIG